MLRKVREQRPSHNNASQIASSVTISSLKLVYYNIFAHAYRLVGGSAQAVMVNSTWTKQHIAQLWWPANAFSSSSTDNNNSSDIAGRRLALVYPPCNTTQLQTIPLVSKGAAMKKVQSDHKRIILSIGQFRPEKDHMLQIRYVGTVTLILNKTLLTLLISMICHISIRAMKCLQDMDNK